jgi:hypothetical protein
VVAGGDSLLLGEELPAAFDPAVQGDALNRREALLCLRRKLEIALLDAKDLDDEDAIFTLERRREAVSALLGDLSHRENRERAGVEASQQQFRPEG